jgi:SAM-dependent methyltransferase
LAKKAGTVDCIELTKRRALGNAYRNRNFDNVNIYVANFEKVKFNKQYDVVVMVGVLEYAQNYTSDDEPYLAFLKKARSLLKPNGYIYISIENRLGMKYFSGAPEDHLGIPYCGIEGYAGNLKVRTFSHSELKSLIGDSGFADTFFYYPLPDYKLPLAIYSDSYLPGKGDFFPFFVAYDQERISAFDEYRALSSLAGTDEFKIFANSFLVEALNR